MTPDATLLPPRIRAPRRLAKLGDPAAAARAVGLRYVEDEAAGITRRRQGKGFRYVGPRGGSVTSPAEIERIAALAIPPAWTDVWICPDPRGHLQATGRDARGRKQYRYHPRWRAVRDVAKYARMVPFGRALPKIRRTVARDLRRPGLPRRKVLAAVVRLLETSLIRVGNSEYARENDSYGLTTLRDRHVGVRGSVIQFDFRAKSGQRRRIEVDDARLAPIVKACREVPGYELFQYLDEEGEPRDVGSGDVNDYLRDVTGEDFSSKEFRTWAGTLHAAAELVRLGPGTSERETKARLREAVEAVAERLGNTPAVCRACYIHPLVVERYREGALDAALKSRRKPLRGLSKEENAVLAFLERELGG